LNQPSACKVIATATVDTAGDPSTVVTVAVAFLTPLVSVSVLLAVEVGVQIFISFACETLCEKRSIANPLPVVFAAVTVGTNHNCGERVLREIRPKCAPRPSRLSHGVLQLSCAPLPLLRECPLM
jgi:hypothetical protein